MKTWLYKLEVILHTLPLMSLFAVNFLNVSISALLVIYVFVCLALIFLVLMQRPKQEGLGAAFGANMTDQMFGARTTNVLQKGTVYLGSLFFGLTLLLAILMQKKNVVNSSLAKEAAAAVAAPKEAVAKSLEEQLKQVVKTEPASSGSETANTQKEKSENGKTENSQSDAAKAADAPKDKQPEANPSAQTPAQPAKSEPVKPDAVPSEGPKTDLPKTDSPASGQPAGQ